MSQHTNSKRIEIINSNWRSSCGLSESNAVSVQSRRSAGLYSNRLWLQAYVL